MFLSEITFFANDNQPYAFDWDPLTRYRKWTRSYSQPWYNVKPYKAEKKNLSVIWRLLRIIVCYLFWGALFFCFAWFAEWPEAGIRMQAKEGWPLWVWWCRVLTYYTAFWFPICLVLMTVPRIMMPYVRTELHTPPLILYFNDTQSWLLLIITVVFWFTVVFSQQAPWLDHLVRETLKDYPYVLGVMRPWLP